MEEIYKKINDLALASARALQSDETGFIHYYYQKMEGPYQAVPLYENLLFALALCKVKTVESVQEAKALLDKLLSYQQASGLFPVYVHDFPYCYDKYIGAELLPPLFWLYHYFHLPLGKEMTERLKLAIERLIAASLEEGMKMPLPKRMKLGGVLIAWGKQDVGKELLDLNAITASNPSCLADCLTGCFCAGEPYVKRALEKMSSFWNSDLGCYCGPFEEMYFIKGSPKVTLFDLYMSGLTHKLSSRLQAPNPALLYGALLFPTHAIEFNPNGNISKTSRYQPGQRGHYPFAFQWGTEDDLSLMALHVPKAKNVLFNEKMIQVDLGECPHFELRDEGKEVIWTIPLKPEIKILVNGQPATTFRAGDLITIEDDKVRIELKFFPDEGLYQGHLSRGCMPTELFQTGSHRFTAYQWLLSWRTIQRNNPSSLKMHFDYVFKN